MFAGLWQRLFKKPTLPENFLGRFWVEIWIAVICVILAASAIAIPRMLPAQAAGSCRMVNGHQVCILRMKRSAKRFWEYRARVSVDGVKRPMERYDCRDRLRLPSDGTFIPYWQDDAVDVVCALFHKRQTRRQAPPSALDNGPVQIQVNRVAPRS